MTDSKAVSPSFSFEEKLKAKIVEGIGDLLSAEDLSKLVEKGIESTFFSRREAKIHEYGQTKVINKESFIEEILREQLSVIVTKLAKELIASKEKEILILVKEHLDKGVGPLMLKALTDIMQMPLMNLQMQMQQSLQNLSNMR